MARTVVTSWFGTFLLEDGRPVRSARAPDDPAALAERARRRRDGALTPEEETILAGEAGASATTRDRRLVDRGVRYDPYAPATVPGESGPPLGRLREALLADADRALAAAWDPSIHVEEAVRAASDLDRVLNLVGERLSSWVGRDARDVDTDDPVKAVRAALAPPEENPLAPADPSLLAARRRLAELYRSLEGVRAELEAAVTAALPARAPNLSSLLGPELAARLLAHAGGLERLARFPASTIQVLGAERAFFEHLRGRAPPPRHGLLFLHPAIQSAPRFERGKLARALAGKVAIAARRDRVGSPVDPRLASAFETRRADLAGRRGRPRRRKGPGRSGPPLHGAPEHR